MGNRKQPFGYRMTLGEITILPEEAELVRFIFQATAWEPRWGS